MKLNKIRAFEHAVKIIELSLFDIEEWGKSQEIIGTENLEELLRINHRGWEILFKTFRFCINGKFLEGHNIITQIKCIKKEGLLTYQMQNLETIFFSEKTQEYFKLLDDLFDDSSSRYNTINDLIGKNSKHWNADEWIKKHVIFQGNNTSNSIEESTVTEIIETNMICLRYIAMHFSSSKAPHKRSLSPIFSKYYSYKNDKFL